MNWILASQLAAMFGFGYLAAWGDMRRRLRRKQQAVDSTIDRLIERDRVERDAAPRCGDGSGFICPGHAGYNACFCDGEPE